MRIIPRRIIGDLTLYERVRGKETWLMKWVVFDGAGIERAQFRRLPAALKWMKAGGA